MSNFLEIVEEVVVNATLSKEIQHNRKARLKAEGARDIIQLINKSLNTENLDADMLRDKCEGISEGLAAGMAYLLYLTNCDEAERDMFHESIRESAEVFGDLLTALKAKLEGNEKKADVGLKKIYEKLVDLGADPAIIAKISSRH